MLRNNILGQGSSRMLAGEEPIQEHIQEPIQEPIQELEKKEGFMEKLKGLWNKTIFPDMIKARREKRKFDTQMKQEIMEEMKPELKEMKKEQMRNQMRDRITGAGREKKMQKLKEAFSLQGTGIGTTESLNRMLGNQPQQQQQPQYTRGVERKHRGRKRKRKVSAPKQRALAPQQQPNKIDAFEDKIKRMLE